jgi:hypothetical protein
MKNTLKKGPMFVTMHPMLIYTGLYFLKLEAGERMEGEPEPIFPFYHKITDEKTLCGACQVQNSDHIVHFRSGNWTDGAYIAKTLV